jgi:serine/threonine protein kinase
VLTGVSDSSSLARFAREAHLVSQVRHENVVRLVDIDVTSDGMLFIVMKLVNGPSLRSSRDNYGRMPWAVAVIRQIAAGLAATHAEGIIHRDLKPANVLLAPHTDDDAPVVKIADFGISTLIARATSEAPSLNDADPKPDDPTTGPVVASTPSPVLDSGLTQTGMVLGTPLYMAPEMLSGARSAKAASDVFSLGVSRLGGLSSERAFTSEGGRRASRRAFASSRCSRARPCRDRSRAG